MAAEPNNSNMLEFPFRRPDGEPLGIAGEYAILRGLPGDMFPVRVWSGDTVYLATRYSPTREAYGRSDLLSSDPRNPGYVDRNAAFAESLSKDRNFRTMDGDEHTEHRAFVAEDFSRRRLTAMRPAVEAIAEQLANAMVKKDSGDVMEDFAFPLAIASLATLIGVPHDQRSFFSARVAACVSGMDREASATAADELASFTKHLFALKMDSPDDDLASRLVEQIEDGLICYDEAVSTVRMLLIGGFETTANTIGLGILAILTRDDQRQMLLDNIEDEKFLGNAANEVIRYASVLQRGHPRVVVASGTVGGIDLEPGDAVFCSAAAANFDPDVFPDPHVLDLARRNAGQHLSFGFGKHACVAQNLARMEIIVALATFFTHLPAANLAVPMSSLEVKPLEAQTIGVVTLPVTW